MFALSEMISFFMFYSATDERTSFALPKYLIKGLRFLLDSEYGLIFNMFIVKYWMVFASQMAKQITALVVEVFESRFRFRACEFLKIILELVTH